MSQTQSQIMSQQSEVEEEAKPVLTASVHDVRYFSALLKGINLSNSNHASVTLTREGGMIVIVEEGRTLLATSYIYPDHFDAWDYTIPEPTRVLSSQLSDLSKADDPEDDRSTSFEIPLNTLIECLNIFGTANLSAATSSAKTKKWRRGEDESDNERGGDNEDNRGGGRGRHRQRESSNAPNNSRLEQYFGANHEKRTSMRLSYGGSGYPLTLLLAEDSTGPTTTCEITTYDPEPMIELPFDGDQTVLKIIFKSSSWLREALSELDPSCDKITFISNPADDVRRAQPRNAATKPLFRILATGSFGSTEMDYPNDREVLETFECTHPISVSYRFGHINKTLRALQSSTKTSLRIEEEGLLSLQFLVPVPKPRGGMSQSFIEFRCLALDDNAE
ncbi:Rad1/Rec1/Rad17 [Hygrophoropsis aurantiaca]|uniref:Rad1/Rec1/Rad17 n=1 Tax=Hygrophoropsis aurantiaca TaxID=72124 RepID=A0ACB8ABY6_9AGAM|nr:Rad1/Rec1/Rad17 [Hygrophoropsis aurantiaca]